MMWLAILILSLVIHAFDGADNDNASSSLLKNSQHPFSSESAYHNHFLKLWIAGKIVLRWVNKYEQKWICHRIMHYRYSPAEDLAYPRGEGLEIDDMGCTAILNWTSDIWTSEGLKYADIMTCACETYFKPKNEGDERRTLPHRQFGLVKEDSDVTDAYFVLELDVIEGIVSRKIIDYWRLEKKNYNQ